MLRLLFVFVLFPFIVFSQSVSISFNVNMKYYIENDLFDPESEFVDLAGGFNGWGSTLLMLEDEDADSIYTRVVEGFTPSEQIEYKFRINALWEGREEFPGAGNNRRYTVADSNNVILVWYNDIRLPTGPPIASFQISTSEGRVNQQIQFTNTSEGIVDTWEWSFENGTPNSSTLEHPLVSFNQPGSYDVQLIASNSKGEADTVLVAEAIEIKASDPVQPKWWNEVVFYEIFVRSFYDSNGDGIGDFNGMTEKLDYLNDGDPQTTDDLGITGIWLMPIHPSPSYHGYDVTDYRDVHPDFGTMDDFKRFLDEAHKRGIRVIIDYVMNHSSSQHPWFEKSVSNDDFYRDFFRWTESRPSYDGPWGQQVWHQRNNDYYYGLFWGGMPDLNYDNQAVKDSIFSAASFWVDEIGVDGFRLDAVKYIFEDGSILEDLPKTHEFFGEFSSVIKQNNPDVFTVGEAWTSTDKVLPYVLNDRIDYCFEFDVANAILGSVSGGDAQRLIPTLMNAYNNYPFLQYGTFLTNHDITRVATILGNNWGRNRAAASLYLTLPGIPYIYYGEEIGMNGDKPDEFIRTPMQWNTTSNAGFTSGNPWIRLNSDFRTKNVELQSNNSSSLLSHYRSLIHARNSLKELQTGEFYLLPSEENKMLPFLRVHEGELGNELTIVVVNLSADTLRNTSFSPIYPDLEQSSKIMVHNALSDAEIIYSLEKEDDLFPLPTLEPYQTYLFKVNETIQTSINQDIPTGFKLSPARPNPFNPSTVIEYSIENNGKVTLEVFDILGRSVQMLVNQTQVAGTYQVQLNAHSFASGTYLLRLVVGNQVAIQKITLVK